MIILGKIIHKYQLYKKKMGLRTIEKKFEHFISLLEGQILRDNPTLTFKDLAKMVESDEYELDKYIFSELGYTGNEVVNHYRETIFMN